MENIIVEWVQNESERHKSFWSWNEKEWQLCLIVVLENEHGDFEEVETELGLAANCTRSLDGLTGSTFPDNNDDKVSEMEQKVKGVFY